MKFRPCIDLHQGVVKQIVGATLGENTVENFRSEKASSYYAELFRGDGLSGGHVIMLGPGNRDAALSALRAFPGGLQAGGGINTDNAGDYIDAGAEKVIMTSAVFHDGGIDRSELERFVRRFGAERLTLDLSCAKKGDDYYIATDGWSRLSPFALSAGLLSELEEYCSEYLIHAVDAEGRRGGIQRGVASIIAEYAGQPVTYAGGISSMADISELFRLTGGKSDFTVGSALDIYGGTLPYRDAINFAEFIK